MLTICCESFEDHRSPRVEGSQLTGQPPAESPFEMPVTKRRLIITFPYNFYLLLHRKGPFTMELQSFS